MASPSVLTLSAPVILTYVGKMSVQMCAQAYPSQKVLLEYISYVVPNYMQQWQFGSDGRIYLYTPDKPPSYCLTFQGDTPADGLPLVIATPSSTDSNQQWLWVNNHFSLQNIGASQHSGTIYCMDLHHNDSRPGITLQLYHSNFDASQLWVAQAWLPPFQAATASE